MIDPQIHRKIECTEGVHEENYIIEEFPLFQCVPEIVLKHLLIYKAGIPQPGGVTAWL